MKKHIFHVWTHSKRNVTKNPTNCKRNRQTIIIPFLQLTHHIIHTLSLWFQSEWNLENKLNKSGTNENTWRDEKKPSGTWAPTAPNQRMSSISVGSIQSSTNLALSSILAGTSGDAIVAQPLQKVGNRRYGQAWRSIDSRSLAMENMIN